MCAYFLPRKVIICDLHYQWLGCQARQWSKIAKKKKTFFITVIYFVSFLMTLKALETRMLFHPFDFHRERIKNNYFHCLVIFKVLIFFIGGRGGAAASKFRIASIVPISLFFSLSCSLYSCRVAVIRSLSTRKFMLSLFMAMRETIKNIFG